MGGHEVVFASLSCAGFWVGAGGGYFAEQLSDYPENRRIVALCCLVSLVVFSLNQDLYPLLAVSGGMMVGWGGAVGASWLAGGRCGGGGGEE